MAANRQDYIDALRAATAYIKMLEIKGCAPQALKIAKNTWEQKRKNVAF